MRQLSLSVFNRNPIELETFNFPFGRWRLDSGRFHFRPGVHFVIIHLRIDAS